MASTKFRPVTTSLLREWSYMCNTPTPCLCAGEEKGIALLPWKCVPHRPCDCTTNHYQRKVHRRGLQFTPHDRPLRSTGTANPFRVDGQNVPLKSSFLSCCHP